MTDEEWAAIRPLLPTPSWLEGRGGQPEGYCHRQMLDAIRYLVAGGISWRAMPADFPDWGRVYAFFRRWREHWLVAEFHDRLRGKVREREGREAEPTAGIIDAQSVKAAANVPAASRGFGGGKLINGRKRHIVTDCLGLLLVVAVTAANTGDREAAVGLLTRLRALHRGISGPAKCAADPGAPIGRGRSDSRGGRPPAFDRETYKQRNTVEPCINRLKQWRDIATRYEKTATIYLAGLHIAGIFLWSGR
ncbi:IS5 family transposase [Streptomyces sp. NPDC057543]|uniref:IS5 family transposase n=1 Tax=Streptomyces sp. NPDC057543 TaxID=3346163 RepID=UPI0036770423